MPTIQLDQNAIIIAQNINATIFTQAWLMRHQLIAEDEFREGSIFTPGVVQAITERFSLVVLPDRLQLAIKPDATEQQMIVERVLDGIVGLLPETPYRAAGMNFVWDVPYPRGEAATAATRRLFRCENPITPFFDADDAQFGGYFSKNMLGGRLKLTVGPVDRPEGERLNLAFNLNLLLEPDRGDAVRKIGEFLHNWEAARAETHRIAASLEND